MRKSLLLVPFLLGLLALPQTAEASFVCTTGYYPRASIHGNAGYVWAFYTSGANCTGSYQGIKYYCTDAATSSQCSLTIRYPLQGVLALYGALVEALQEQTATTDWTTTCNGGASGCGGYVQFDA